MMLQLLPRQTDGFMIQAVSKWKSLAWPEGSSCFNPTKPPACEAPLPKLLDRGRESVRARHYSRRTEESYVHWIKRFIFFHGKRHRMEMIAGGKGVDCKPQVLDRGPAGVRSPFDDL
jgi:Phage integrase, N-terminal SAM-like domain